MAQTYYHDDALATIIGLLGTKAYYALLERLDRDLLILQVVRDELKELKDCRTQLNETTVNVATATEGIASNFTPPQQSPKKTNLEETKRKRVKEPNTAEKCTVCDLPIDTPEDKAFSENQENHPGVLGQLHIKCYQKVCDERPDTPWTDPISGEIDFEGMSEDLGMYPGTEDQVAEEEGEGAFY